MSVVYRPTTVKIRSRFAGDGYSYQIHRNYMMWSTDTKSGMGNFDADYYHAAELIRMVKVVAYGLHTNTRRDLVLINP